MIFINIYYSFVEREPIPWINSFTAAWESTYGEQYLTLTPSLANSITIRLVDYTLYFRESQIPKLTDLLPLIIFLHF